MKFLRALYMIIASIVLFPLIVLVEIIWFIVLAVACAMMHKSMIEAVRVWLKYLRSGVDMNLDFIENGFNN